MKQTKLFLIVMMILVPMTVLAAPGPFGFTSANPLPDGTLITDEYTEDLVGITNSPTRSDIVVWHLWEGDTVGTVDNAIASINLILTPPPDLEWTLTIPADTLNNLNDGDYIWDIIATDNADGSTTSISGGPFTFSVDFLDLPIPADGGTVSGPGWTEFSFEDRGGDWYLIWVGYGAASSNPYGYTAFTGWYQADDDSVFGTPGAGICANGVCTIPADDTIGAYIGGNENYEWWITYYSEAMPDFMNQWENTRFTLAYPAPATTLPDTTPVDGMTVTTAPTEITWAQDAGTLWYQVWLGPNDYTDTLETGWYFADDICANNVCSIDVSAATFVPGTSYEMWFEFWGPGGYAAWGDIANSPLNFGYENP